MSLARVLPFFALLAAVALPQHAQAEVPQQLRACGDVAEFPPYTIVVRNADGIRTGEPGGYNIDYLNALLAAEGRSVRYTLLPWKRCLAMAAKGDFDIILDVSDSPERQHSFLLAQGHYMISPGLIYRTSEPTPRVRNAQDFARYRRCEILGWDYSPLGIKVREGVSQPASVEAAMAMLRAGRCQIMYYNLELLEGLEEIQALDRMKGLAYLPLPWMKRYQLHFGVPRPLPYAEELRIMLDRGIDQMRKSGEAARLLERRIKASVGGAGRS
jgi:ABC-type amino acid transport substrate-binding protein